LHVLSELFVSLWDDSWFFSLFPSRRTRVIIAWLKSNFPLGAKLMEWTTPQHEEIDLNCEVSSYANAEL